MNLNSRSVSIVRGLPFVLVFLGIWLVPTKYIEQYVVLECVLILVFSGHRRFQLCLESRLALGFLIYLFLSATIRFFVFWEPQFRDFTEIGRLIPIVLILGFYRAWEGFKYDYLLIALVLYVGLDSCVTYLQTIGRYSHPLVVFAQRLYSSPQQYELSLLTSERALGFSSGPGQHGTIMVMCLCLSLVALFYYPQKKTLSVASIILSFYGIVSSQSRRALVGAMFILACCTLHELARGRMKRKLVAAAVCLVLVSAMGSAVISEWIMGKGYLARLFTQGIETSSYRARQDKWARVLEQMERAPFLVVIGYGKSFLGAESGAMDSEYLFMISVYGAVAAAALVCLFLRFMFRRSLDWRGTSASIYQVALFYAMVAGLPMAWAGSFWLDPRVLYTLVTLLPLCRLERMSCAHDRYLGIASD